VGLAKYIVCGLRSLLRFLYVGGYSDPPAGGGGAQGGGLAPVATTGGPCPPTGHLNRLFAPVFEEVDLQEAWVEAATDAGGSAYGAVAEFHDWIRADDGTGVRRQDRLKDPQTRSPVRRALQAEIKHRFSN